MTKDNQPNTNVTTDMMVAEAVAEVVVVGMVVDTVVEAKAVVINPVR